MNKNFKIALWILTIFGIDVKANSLDIHYLTQAYKSYKAEDYNNTIVYLKEIKLPSLQSKITLANTFYKQKEYKKAIASYKSIQSTSKEIKQQLYYNIANSYAKLFKYKNAKIYYAKVLQIGSDVDAENNLRLIALLFERKNRKLGVSHPKSQNSASSKSEKYDDKETKRDEDKPSSSSSEDGKSGKEREQEEERKKLKSNNKEEKHPLSSKVYELINEGYIYEKQPW